MNPPQIAGASPFPGAGVPVRTAAVPRFARRARQSSLTGAMSRVGAWRVIRRLEKDFAGRDAAYFTSGEGHTELGELRLLTEALGAAGYPRLNSRARSLYEGTQQRVRDSNPEPTGYHRATGP